MLLHWQLLLLAGVSTARANADCYCMTSPGVVALACVRFASGTSVGSLSPTKNEFVNLRGWLYEGLQELEEPVLTGLLIEWLSESLAQNHVE